MPAHVSAHAASAHPDGVRVLVANAGSSSLKLSWVHDGSVEVARELPAPQARIDPRQVQSTLEEVSLRDIQAVGHRIVHGGPRFRQAVIVDEQVERALRELVAIAPLHQPKSLAALDAISAVLPDIPAVACFDTSFHATLPAAASTYALPQKWIQRWELRRYGFHGLSHAWVARRAPEILQVSPDGLRVVSCHLGAGASLCAIRDGKSVDTTMGFTPLEGLVMATRSGTVDPGLLLWLLEQSDLSPSELAEALEHESGLLGLTGDADMRVVLARSNDGDARARLGVEVYIHRLRQEIASMAASMGGLDVLVFTGGVGERAPEIRRRAVAGLGFLGLTLDDAANARAGFDACVETSTSAASILVLQAREDLEIARQVESALTVA